MTSPDTPDTGAGTPLTAEEVAAIRERHHVDPLPETGIDGKPFYPSWCIADNQTWPCDAARLLTPRPATDPAGLDACPYCAAWHALDHNADNARLSVADGPGPEERAGFCGSCGTPDHYAGDRTHPCLPVREETTDG